MNDLLTRAWNALTPEQRPVGMGAEKIWGGHLWTTGSYFIPDAAAYDRLCVACESVAYHYGLTPCFSAGGWWGGDAILEVDRWGWNFGCERITHTCRLTAAVLAIEAINGGDK